MSQIQHSKHRKTWKIRKKVKFLETQGLEERCCSEVLGSHFYLSHILDRLAHRAAQNQRTHPHTQAPRRAFSLEMKYLETVVHQTFGNTSSISPKCQHHNNILTKDLVGQAWSRASAPPTFLVEGGKHSASPQRVWLTEWGLIFLWQ